MAKYLRSSSLAANALPDKITAVSLLLSQSFLPGGIHSFSCFGIYHLATGLSCT